MHTCIHNTGDALLVLQAIESDEDVATVTHLIPFGLKANEKLSLSVIPDAGVPTHLGWNLQGYMII